MAKTDAFRITYVGGGSRFVVTLLHGLAAYAPAFRRLKRPVELALLDPNPDRAGEMGRYAEITARTTGIDIRPIVTSRPATALKGSDLVIISVGMYDRIHEAQKLFDAPGLQPYGEHGPGVIIEGAALWPFVKRLAKDIQRYAPKATFATIMNPTDVLAAAVEKAFGIPSVGVCVEVPGLLGWLSYYLEVDDRKIHLDHVGVNHVGWVSRWRIDGVPDAEKFFWRKIPPRIGKPDWYPHPIFFVELYEATGFMRSSPYHNWPFKTTWSDDKQKQNDRWAATCLPKGKDKRVYRNEQLERALAEGRMIPEADGTKVHPEATPYTYPNSRWTLGGLALGMAGGKAGPMPLQVRNGRSNPGLPADAWLEIPATVSDGKIAGKTIKPPPDWLFHDTETIAVQRIHLANWLAGQDKDGLMKGLTAMPNVGTLEGMLHIVRDLHKVRDAKP